MKYKALFWTYAPFLIISITASIIMLFLIPRQIPGRAIFAACVLLFARLLYRPSKKSLEEVISKKLAITVSRTKMVELVKFSQTSSDAMIAITFILIYISGQVFQG